MEGTVDLTFASDSVLSATCTDSEWMHWNGEVLIADLLAREIASPLPTPTTTSVSK